MVYCAFLAILEVCMWCALGFLTCDGFVIGWCAAVWLDLGMRQESDLDLFVCLNIELFLTRRTGYGWIFRRG